MSGPISPTTLADVWSPSIIAFIARATQLCLQSPPELMAGVSEPEPVAVCFGFWGSKTLPEQEAGQSCC